jgi:hypothetical protein
MQYQSYSIDLGCFVLLYLAILLERGPLYDSNKKLLKYWKNISIFFILEFDFKNYFDSVLP